MQHVPHSELFGGDEDFGASRKLRDILRRSRTSCDDAFGLHRNQTCTSSYVLGSNMPISVDCSLGLKPTMTERRARPTPHRHQAAQRVERAISVFVAMGCDFLVQSGQQDMIEFKTLRRVNGGKRHELRPRRPVGLARQLTVVDMALPKRLPGMVEPPATFGLEDDNGLIGFESRSNLVQHVVKLGGVGSGYHTGNGT